MGISKYEQITIAAFLSEKLGLGEDWFNISNELLNDKTPCEVVNMGQGDMLIQWLWDRCAVESMGKKSRLF